MNKRKIFISAITIVTLGVALISYLLFENYYKFSVYDVISYDDYNTLLDDMPYYSVMPEYDEGLDYQDMYIVYEKESKYSSWNNRYLSNVVVVTDKYTIDCRYCNLGILNPIKKSNYIETIIIGSIPVHINYEVLEHQGITQSFIMFTAMTNKQIISIYDMAIDYDSEEHYNNSYTIIYDVMESLLTEYSERVVW